MRHAAATKLKVKEETTTPPPIPPPSSAQTDAAVTKAYSDRIHRLVEEISKLSLLDVMDLNELLKVTPSLHISTSFSLSLS